MKLYNCYVLCDSCYVKNMYEKLDEKIDVLVEFSDGKVLPNFFRWQDRTYKIEKINLVHSERKGNDKIYYFSVSNNVNFFRLAFFTRDLSWRIQELYYE